MPFTLTNAENLPHRIEVTRQNLLAALHALDGFARSAPPPVHSMLQARKALAEAGRGLQNLSSEIEMLGIQLGGREAREQEAFPKSSSRANPFEEREAPFTD